MDVELERKMPPDVLWHGSVKKYIDLIDKQGLLSKSRLYVHLSRDYNTAINVGRRNGEPVFYEMAASKMAEDGYDFTNR